MRTSERCPWVGDLCATDPAIRPGRLGSNRAGHASARPSPQAALELSLDPPSPGSSSGSHDGGRDPPLRVGVDGKAAARGPRSSPAPAVTGGGAGGSFVETRAHQSWCRHRRLFESVDRRPALGGGAISRVWMWTPSFRDAGLRALVAAAGPSNVDRGGRGSPGLSDDRSIVGSRPVRTADRPGAGRQDRGGDGMSPSADLETPSTLSPSRRRDDTQGCAARWTSGRAAAYECAIGGTPGRPDGRSGGRRRLAAATWSSTFLDRPRRPWRIIVREATSPSSLPRGCTAIAMMLTG